MGRVALGRVVLSRAVRRRLVQGGLPWELSGAESSWVLSPG